MRILSLNGGGCRGYMSAVILSKIEEETGKNISDLFDIVAGVSTGSIIAACIGKGLSASMVAKLYKELSQKIFKSKSWLPWTAWYSADKLEEVVKDILEYQFNTSKTKIMISAAEIDGPDVLKPKFWKSWQETDSIKANDIVVASCSAPIYFAPKVMGKKVFIDGGFVANNPSMCGIVEAMKLGVDKENICNLNINCGEQKGFDKAQKLSSIYKWIPNISGLITLAVNTGERSVAYQSQQLIGTRHIEVGPSIDLPLDTLEFDIMDREAHRIWIQNKDAILALIRNTKKEQV